MRLLTRLYCILEKLKVATILSLDVRLYAYILYGIRFVSKFILIVSVVIAKVLAVKVNVGP